MEHHLTRTMTGRRAQSIRRFLGRCAARLARCAERRRQRTHLSELDDHLLRDIGLTRAMARVEARKPGRIA